MSERLQVERYLRWRAPVAVLAATPLYNLGMGLLRPTLPLYLQQVFAVNYQMVTLILVVSTVRYTELIPQWFHPKSGW